MKSSWCVVTIAVVFALACTAHADKTSAASTDKTVSPAPTAESRGQAILKAQIAAVKNWSDRAPMTATFTKSAVVLLPNGEYKVESGVDVATAIAFLNPHATVKDASFDHFVSSGNASVGWFSADLHFTVASTEPGEKPFTETHVVRAIELMDGAADWKVAVAGFTNVSKLQAIGSCPISDSTTAGTLTNLLVTPENLAKSLDPSAVVLGTDVAERGNGPDAKSLVAKWKNLKLSLDVEQKAREVHTNTYGYAMTNVKIAAPKPGAYPQAMSAFVLALPTGPDSWSVVAASYGATF